MPTIRKRATSWEAQVRKRGWPTVTRSFPTKADAVQWATERENEMRRGTFVDTSNLRETTLKDLLEKFRDDAYQARQGAGSVPAGRDVRFAHGGSYARPGDNAGRHRMARAA